MGMKDRPEPLAPEGWSPKQAPAPLGTTVKGRSSGGKPGTRTYKGKGR